MTQKKELLEKRIYGDYTVVAQVLSKRLNKYVTPSNAAKMIEREGSRHHGDAIDILKQIIETREAIISQ